MSPKRKKNPDTRQCTICQKSQPFSREGLRSMQIPIHRSGGNIGHQNTVVTSQHPLYRKPGSWQALSFRTALYLEACRQCHGSAEVQSDLHHFPASTWQGRPLLFSGLLFCFGLFEVNIKPHGMHLGMHRNYAANHFQHSSTRHASCQFLISNHINASFQLIVTKSRHSMQVQENVCNPFARFKPPCMN